jgi:hypothetical protein
MRHRFEWQVARGAITKRDDAGCAKPRLLKFNDWRTTARQRDRNDQMQRQKCRQRIHGVNLQRQARRWQVNERDVLLVSIAARAISCAFPINGRLFT